jgi:hypothetical protein
MPTKWKPQNSKLEVLSPDWMHEKQREKEGRRADIPVPEIDSDAQITGGGAAR